MTSIDNSYGSYSSSRLIWHQPPTANNNQQNHSQPWPPLSEMAPLHPTWSLVPRADVSNGWAKNPEQADIVLGGVEGVYGPQDTPMLPQCIITITWECFEGHTHPQHPPKLHSLAWGLLTIHSTHWRRAQGLMWGTGGLFLPAAAMVVAVVTPVVLVLRLLKNAIKTLKLVVCEQCLYLILYTVKHKHIATHVTLIVAWPEPESLRSNGTPAYWVSPESSCHGKDYQHIVLRP